MKSKWNLFSAIIQIIVGVLAVIAFVVITINGEEITRWIITLVLAIAYVITGVISVITYYKE